MTRGTRESIGRRRVLAGLGAACATALAGRIARADAVSDALAEIARARASVKTLVAPFSQEREIGLLASSVKSDGEMTLVRPDRLRWELKPPDAIVYWIGPEGLSYATPGGGGGSASKKAAGRFGAVLSDLLILIGGDLEQLRSRYELAIPKRNDLGLTLLAKPKNDEVARMLQSIEMSVGAELWTVQRIVLIEPNEDKSTIAFGKVARDVKVDPERMKPPKKKA
jgi:outer membrane lipoprotein-sorting protein